MPAETEPLVDYHVSYHPREGEYVHVTALGRSGKSQDPSLGSGVPYAAEEGLFTQDTARQFFGVTCGMSERTRNRVVDQIDFAIADDIDPEHEESRLSLTWGLCAASQVGSP